MIYLVCVVIPGRGESVAIRNFTKVINQNRQNELRRLTGKSNGHLTCTDQRLFTICYT